MKQLLLFDIDKYTTYCPVKKTKLKEHKSRADYSGAGVKCVNSKVIIVREGKKVIEDYDNPTLARQIAEMYRLFITLKTLGN